MVFLFLLDLTSPHGFCREAVFEKIEIHGLYKVILLMYISVLNYHNVKEFKGNLVI